MHESVLLDETLNIISVGANSFRYGEETSGIDDTSF